MAWKIILKSTDCPHKYTHSYIVCMLTNKNGIRCSQKKCAIKLKKEGNERKKQK